VFLGGLMGGTLGVTIVIRKQNLSWIKCADIVAPLLILGYAIGRVGCFLVGDDYGIPTLSFLGITFENGLPPTTYNVFQTYYPWVDLSGFGPGLLAVHPTQLYETTAGLAIFAFLWNKRTHVTVAGSLFFTYLILAGLERFFIEFIRTNDHYLFDLTGSQLISIIMIIIGTIGLFRHVSTPETST
jgi:phosphatidylglycerol:prolipoprotein diacylglycerol transferase